MENTNRPFHLTRAVYEQTPDHFEKVLLTASPVVVFAGVLDTLSLSAQAVRQVVGIVVHPFEGF